LDISEAKQRQNLAVQSKITVKMGTRQPIWGYPQPLPWVCMWLASILHARAGVEIKLEGRNMHIGCFRSKTETKSCCSEQNNGPSGHAPTHMGVPIAVTLGLYVVGIHITCQGWRGEKVRGSQPAYWVFQKRNRAKILTFCCPVNKNVTDVFLM
jgi:hypothetical protein